MAVIYGTLGDNTKNGTTGQDKIYGWAEGDNAFSPSGNDTLFGNAGNDKLFGGTGNDELYGDAGNDRLFGSGGNNRLFGGAGNDRLFGGAGNDRLFGGAGNDELYAGNDELYEDGRNSNLDGGAGNDELAGNTGDTLDGGVGEDLLYLYLDYQTAGFLFDGSASTHLRLADGTTARNGESFFVSGGSGNDTLIGAAGNDELYGGAGNDELYGGAGNDSLRSNAGDTDTLDGGVGEDLLSLDLDYQIAGFLFDGSASTHLRLADGTTARNGESFFVSGGSGNDTLIGAAGFDELFGNGGNDSLVGSAGDDMLYGGYEGNDYLDGGAGNDTLLGGDGKDLFSYSTLEAFTKANVGIDVIQFFSHNYDSIVLNRYTFITLSSAQGSGFSNASEFAIVGSNSAAATSMADIVYNLTNGNLFYNPNGSATGFGTGGQFATLADNPFVSAKDFTIQ